jgi:Ca2+-binding RTX toxin-like protein
VRSHISSIIIFYSIAMLIISSSFLLSSVATPSQAVAGRSSKNTLVLSNVVGGTAQLPLPTPGVSSQFTDGQDNFGCASGPGSINTINDQGQGAICASGPGSTNNRIINNDINIRIQGVNVPSPSSSLASENVMTCRPLIPCNGTNRADIIMAAISEKAFGLDGNDMIFGAADDQLYGGGGNDIILVGPGNSLADGGPGNDVLMGGIDHSLLVGGTGNDKLFAGPGDTVMSGGSGANHFNCPASGAGLARSIVLDYDPANGDTISGQCTLINNAGSSASGGATKPTLSDSRDSSSGNSLEIQGLTASWEPLRQQLQVAKHLINGTSNTYLSKSR